MLTFIHEALRNSHLHIFCPTDYRGIICSASYRGGHPGGGHPGVGW